MKNIILILSSFLLFSCSNVYQPAVVSARKEATQIGLEIMKNGGNAYDAMIATHLALAVVHPTAGNIGGGGFFVYHHKDGSSGSLDFREMAPEKAFKDMYLDKNGDVIPDMSTLGGAAVGVPGSISAIYKIHSKFGSLPIEDLFEPAINLAKNGFVVTQKQSNSLTGKLEDFIKVNGEKLFKNLNKELPYNLMVETEKWDIRSDKSINIQQTIFVNKSSHKPIILGKAGQNIKRICILARKDLEKLLDSKIHLFLFVKFKKNWMEDPSKYSSIGLNYNA